MAIKTDKDEIYFKYFQQLFETIEKDTVNPAGSILNHFSHINTNSKEKEFGSYINSFINKKLTKNGN